MTQDADDQTVDLADLEDLAKSDKRPPKAKTYRIRLDKLKYDVSKPGMTGAEILALAGKTPVTHLLSQKFRGGVVEAIAPTQFVDFRNPGVERFQTIATDPTEG